MALTDDELTVVSGAGVSEHRDILITKHIDKSSPKLYEAVSTGKHFKEAVLQLA